METVRKNIQANMIAAKAGTSSTGSGGTSPRFLQTETETEMDRTFTFEMFKTPDAQLNVQSLQDVIQSHIQD